jgi:hypothetical protein
MDNNDIELKIKSHQDGEAYSHEDVDFILKQLLIRIEDLEERQADIRYFLANPKTLPY